MRWESMSKEAKIHTISRFHRAMNRRLFGGDLRDPLLYVDFVDGTAEGILGGFGCDSSREWIFLTGLYEQRIERFGTVKGQTLFCVIVLLHEMIHQYCYEHGIDGKEHATHGDRYKEIAEGAGLVSCYDSNGDYYNKAAPSLATAVQYYRFG